MSRPSTTRLLCSFLLVGAGAAGELHAQHRPDAAMVRSTVDSLARAFIEAGESPGVSIQVVRGSDTLVSRGWGMANLDEQVPASASTLYRIGSITKQFTASAVMREVEEGKLSLADPIGLYLPELPATWRPATVRELLNHTSGIPSYTDIGERWERRWREDLPPDSLVALTAQDSLWFAPGSDWRYDNSGYVVLGMLLSKIEGKPYPQFVEEELLLPLGLQHTYYCDLDRVLLGRAPGYTHASGTFRHAARLSMTQPYAAGALCSTVGDLARWNVLLATGSVVKPESYRAMTTPVGAAAAHHYGFGVVSTSIEGHREIEHSGGILGFASDNAYFPDDSLSVTVLANADGSHPSRLLVAVARTALGLPLRR